MQGNDTEQRIKKIRAKLNGLQLNKEQKTQLAQEINQLALILIDMYKAKKVAE